MYAETGIHATTSLQVCEDFQADFAVIAVNKENIADVCEEWVNLGYPVVSETPAGSSLEKLYRLWELHERKDARITVVVRGEKGEWNDNLIYYIDEKNQPKREYLMPVIREKYSSLDTQDLRDLRKTWQPELFLDTRQDEYAIATMLFDMRDYLAGGG